MSKKDIVLHICCAPCQIYPLQKLRSKDYSVRGFFYNPNIHPQQEYNRRKKTVLEYSGDVCCDVYICPDDHRDEFFNAISHTQTKPKRCQICWFMRLKKTAEYAKKINVNTFTTTLLVSPYQDSSLLKSIGEKVAAWAGVDFYFQDFKQGYQQALRISKEQGLYRQKYCGCLFSLKERNSSELTNSEKYASTRE